MNIVGDSYTLPEVRASAQRAVNLYLRALESQANTRGVLVKFPGLVRVAIGAGAARGAIETRGRAFVVFGQTLYELGEHGSLTPRGQLLTSDGTIGIAEGLSQVVIVDGVNGYVLRMMTNVFERITSPAWLGSDTVTALNNRFIFQEPGTQHWYYSEIDDATDLDALDIASAEAAPDDLVAVIASHQEIHLFGTRTKEVFYDAGAADFTFVRNTGATAEVGITAAHTLRKIDNGLIWLGRDENGNRGVMRAEGYAPRRVSTAAVEIELEKSTDISAATAFTMAFRGMVFYVLTAPGLQTSWALEISTGRWCELADIDTDGHFIAWRGVAHVYAFGSNWVFGRDGAVYKLDHDFFSYGDDPIVCERTAPDDVKPLLMRRFFGAFVAEVETRGVQQEQTPLVELSWSDDGGHHYGNPMLRSLGRIGERPTRLAFHRTGQARDRVWRLRYSGNTGFSVIAGGTEG